MARLYLPDAELAYTRTVLLAVEVLDAVTLAPVTAPLRVGAPPLPPPAIVNPGGRYIWLLAGPQRPARVTVEPGELPYGAEQQAAPVLPVDPDALDQLAASERLVRIWLRPRRGYQFPAGMTVVRGRLDDGAGALRDAELWLQWMGAEPSATWQQERQRTFTRTDQDGEFVLFLPGARAVAAALDKLGQITVRIVARRGEHGGRVWDPFQLRDGRPLEQYQKLTW